MTTAALVLAICALGAAGEPPASAPTAPATPSVPAAPHDPRAPAGPAAEAGFTLLFNGRDLSGWTGDTAGYTVENGAIVCGPKGSNLFTAREFADFVLRFQFQLTPGANNGIGVRAPLEGDAAYEGMEVQVLDSEDPKYKGKIQPWQCHGSVYGILAAKPVGMKAVGEWNSQEISLIGRRIRVTLNGSVLVDADLDEAAKSGTLDGKPHKGLKRTSGHIGFLGHGDRVSFRNIQIREVAAAPKPDSKTPPTP